MKNFNGISLRLRLTLLTAAIMILMAGLLTYGSITRADSYFIPDNYLVTLTGRPTDTTIDVTKKGTYSFPAKDITTSRAEKVIPMADISLYTTIAPGNSARDTTNTEEAVFDNPEHTKINGDSAAYAETEAKAVYPLERITLTGAAKKKFAFSSTWMMLIVMITGIFLAWIMAGRALKPVTELANAVDTIDEHNLSTRITNMHSNDEIQQLAESFNHMLDKLEQAFIQQRTFAANAAHELKTPLAAIRTNLEVLDMEDKPSLEDYQETMDVINRNSERLISLVGNLLELNEQQNIDLYECISTKKMFQQLRTEQTAAIAEKSLTIAINNQVPTLYGNEQLLTSALRNLLENAIKYHHVQGNIRLILISEADTAQITVWDDGPGIPENQLPYIFEPFYRCDPSRSSKIKGSGLGLALVQTIVQRHRGTMTVHSSPEKGTSFTITLPNQKYEL